MVFYNSIGSNSSDLFYYGGIVWRIYYEKMFLNIQVRYDLYITIYFIAFQSFELIYIITIIYYVVRLMELENGYVENLDRSKISNPLIDDTLLAKARIQFIRKVFIILSIQILITVIMTLGSMFATEYFLYQLDNMWLLYSFIGLLTITQITVLFFPAGRKYPLNMVLLLFFTIGEGYFVSFICSIAGKASGNDVVFMAAIMSLSVVIAATVYAFHTKDDFIIKWGILIVIICSLLMMTIFLATGYSEAAYTIYCTLAAIIFGIYIIIDIKSICGSRRYGMSLDDYVAGAIILYIDIIQLFLYIIRILSKKK